MSNFVFVYHPDVRLFNVIKTYPFCLRVKMTPEVQLKTKSLEQSLMNLGKTQVQTMKMMGTVSAKF